MPLTWDGGAAGKFPAAFMRPQKSAIHPVDGEVADALVRVVVANQAGRQSVGIATAETAYGK